MENSKGLVTIPTDLDVVPETLELMKRWGADAIRDCDGTDFPEALKDADAEIYSTYYTTRKDNEWAKANPEEIQQMYLMTPFYTADSESLSIEIMKGLYPDMLSPNTRDDIKRWWEVVDRTTGKVVPTDEWDYNEEEGKVTIKAVPFHEYTVSFLAYIMWDPVHMYNAVTNDWKDVEHQITFDVRQPIHPSLNNYRNSLANALMWYYEQQNKPFIFRCTNRLDRDTSGLTVVAKHMVSSNILSSMTARHQIEREYLAIVRGHVTPFEGTINAPIGRTGSSLIERKIDFENGEHAITHYHTVFEKNGLSLVSLILETGRTHQIRVHMKHLGFPLIGDYLYNPDMELIDRQALHSHCLRFLHPITGRQMTFTADLPEDMARLFA